MKNELDYFYVEKTFGGNQDWFRDHWMHLGGCAAVAACDSCIAIENAGIRAGLCPFDIRNIKKSDYIDFGMRMKPYLKPRWTGIDRIDIYIDGFKRYLSEIENVSLQMDAFEADNQLEAACDVVKQKIHEGFPVPFLLLRHKDNRFHDLLWHWFMLVGYKENQNELYVKIATYGEAYYVSFRELWDSGYRNNGGMVLYS